MRLRRLECFADGYVRECLRLMERMRGDDSPDPATLHRLLADQLRQGRVACEGADWELAAYPLATWTDECLLSIDWPGKRWWVDHLLETSLFGSRIGGQRYFELSRRVAADSQHPTGPMLLRIYYECVALGFRGVYAIGGGAAFRESLKLPATLEHWQTETAQILSDWNRERSLQSDEAKKETPRIGRTLTLAQPLVQRHRLVWWTCAAVTLALLNGILWIYRHVGAGEPA
ncbi:MAG: DotU family type IV/VI secretion system protein [Planctomycetota bacterium]